MEDILLNVFIAVLAVSLVVMIVSMIIKCRTFSSGAITVSLVSSVITALCSLGILSCAVYALITGINGGMI